MFCYNSVPHTVTGHSPIYLLFGIKPRTPLDARLPITDKVDVSERLEQLQKAHNEATEGQKQRADVNKAHYDSRQRGGGIEPGDHVLSLMFHC